MKGIEPYPYAFSRSHQTDEAASAFAQAETEGRLGEDGDGLSVCIAGRILSWRGHGKSAFAHLEDGAGRATGLLPQGRPRRG